MPEVLDALTLARAQFAFTISTHILFASLSLGLASWMAVLEGLWLWRRDARCRALFDVWKPVFATVFGMGLTPFLGGSGSIVDLTVWGYALIAVIVLALAVGLPPALRARRLNIVDALAGR